MLSLKEATITLLFCVCFPNVRAMTWNRKLDGNEAIFDRDSIEDSNLTLALCRDSDQKYGEKICTVNQNILTNEMFSTMVLGHECEVVLEPENEFSSVKKIKAVSYGSGRVILAWINEDKWGSTTDENPRLLKFSIIFTEDCSAINGEISFEYTVDKTGSFLSGNTILTNKDGTFDIYVPNYTSVKKYTFNSFGRVISESRLSWLSNMNFDCLSVYPIEDLASTGRVMLACDDYQNVLLSQSDGSVKGLSDIDVDVLSTENNLIGFCTADFECWQYRANGYLQQSFRIQFTGPNTEIMVICNLPQGGFLAIFADERRDFHVSTIDVYGRTSEAIRFDSISCARNGLVSRAHKRSRNENGRIIEEYCFVLVCKSNELLISFKCYEILNDGSLRVSSD